ncbi:MULTISPECIES: MFS transporter [Alteromonadaceae]|uniref:MFS transporter n=1 Tax=Brumicola blandensis TaxID=3075611 RepID=A0AAW8R489_9ALTE|nr:MULTISPECIES: MFS transporter [unclassified Alteromonas]MDT0583730.1 MFS transporter [Alteromonas sp. W409]MDT0629145.1 MFS transporter [Alteromonas sp. W364]
MRKLPLDTIALIAVCAGYLIAPMGMAAVNVAIPALAEDLQANAIKVAWLPTLYILSNVALMLPFGKIADNYGRKRIYVWGLALNAIAAGMCAIATNIDWILFWRFIQGASGAMIFGTGVAIITAVAPSNKRGTALGIVASCVYIGLTLAPALGGWLTELLGWRSVFYFQIPLVVALLVYIKVYLPGDWKNDHHSRFDWIGSAIFILFSCSLVYGFSKLPSVLGIGLLGVAVLSLLGFIQHQRYVKQPLIRVQMFKESRVFSLSLSTSLLMYASNFAIIFLLSLYLQYVNGLSPAEAGQILLLQALCMAIVAPFAGKLSDRFQPRIVATSGCFIVACGFIMLNQIDVNSQPAFIGAGLALVGLGFGLFSTPNNSAIMGAVNEQEVGVASASMNLSRTIGNLVGMSLVNLMMHHYIGDATFTPEQNPALMLTVSLALKMSLSFVVIACLFSAVRGRQ